MFTIKVPSKDVAIIKTGGSVAKVYTDSWCCAIWVIQKIQKIPLSSFVIRVVKSGERKDPLITKDVHADIDCMFYVKVDSSTKESILKAYETIGYLFNDVNNTSNVSQFFEPKFSDALRSASSQKTLIELQEERAKFSKEVGTVLLEQLKNYGLILEEVAIQHLGQTPINILPDDIFGARSKQVTTENVMESKSRQQKIQAQKDIEISQTNLEKDKQNFSIELDRSNAKIEAEKKTIDFQAEKEISISQSQALIEQEKQKAEINKEIEIKKAEGVQYEIEAQTSSKKEYANTAEAKAIEAKAVGEAEIRKKVIQIDAEAEANGKKISCLNEAQILLEKKQIEKMQAIVEGETLREKAILNKETVVKNAEAHQDVKKKEAETDFEVAKKKADAIKVLSEAKAIENEVNANGVKLMNEAENMMSLEVRTYNLKMAITNNAADMIRAMVEPINNIDKFTVISANGMFGGNTGNNQSSGGVQGIYDGALEYKYKDKVAEELLGELGITKITPSEITKNLMPTPVINIGESQKEKK